METTLNKISATLPFKDEWKKLLCNLKKDKADDEPLKITYVLEVCGLDTALWCLRAVDGFEKEKRLFAIWCARRAEKNIKCIETLHAINVAERFAMDQVSTNELTRAWSSADICYDGGWVAHPNPAIAAFTSAKWFAAFGDRNEDERLAQEKEFRRMLHATDLSTAA